MTVEIDTQDLLNHPEVIKKTIIVDYSRSKEEAILSTEHGQNSSIRAIDNVAEVIEIAPQNGEGKQENEVFFIPHTIIPEKYCTEKGNINDHALEVFFKENGLASIDLHTAAAISEEDPRFSDQQPYAIHFSDGDDGWFSAIFYRWLDGYGLAIGKREAAWKRYRNWYFAVYCT